MASRTLAQIQRAKRWNDYPAQLGDVMQSAWHGLAQRWNWKEFRSKVTRDEWPEVLVVGRESPEAETTFFDDGSVLITVSDGLIRFLQNVCNALFALANYRGEAGHITEAAALGREQADELLLRTYRQWAELQRGSIPPVHSVVLGAQATEMARHHLIHSLLFVVLHEFGHATLHRDCKRDAQLEIDADIWGLDTLLTMDGRPTIKQNLVLSGAVVSLRAFAALDVLGLWHLGDYPPPSTRFQTMMGVFRRRAPDGISFYVASTYAFTTDLRMEAAERAIRGAATELEPIGPHELSHDQIVSHIVSLLVEMYLKRMTQQEAADIANRVLARSNVRPGQVLDLATDTFSSAQPSYAEDSQWGEVVRYVIDNRTALQALLR